jgi:hypothetical protein
MKKFLKWLASSPTASALKIVLGGSLAIAVDYIDSFNLPPTVALLITALVPLAIDALNPHDPRFGKGKTPTLADFLEAIVPVITKAKPEAEPIVKEITPVIEAAAKELKKS